VNYTLTIKAYDIIGDVVSESTYEAPSKQEADDFAEEWIDRLTRRRVPYVYVTRDYGTASWLRPRDVYASLFAPHPSAFMFSN
jgi:hypothetical protein